MQLHLAAPAGLNSPVERSNFVNLVLDVAWFGVALAATTRFLSVFALRLGATPLELGLLAGLPQLVLLVSSMLGAPWLRRFSSARAGHPLPSLGFRLAFLLPAFAVFLPPQWQPLYLVMAVTVPAIPQGIASVAFLVMLREAVPDPFHAALHSKRVLWVNIMAAISAVLFGLLLQHLPFPLNYQVMFAVAFGFTLLSLHHCNLVQPILPIALPAPRPQRRPDAPPLWKTPSFVKLVVACAAVHAAQSALLPIVPIRLVDELGADEAYMALFSLIELGGGALITLVTQRAAARLGTQTLMAVSMVVMAVAALLLAFTTDLSVALLGAALTGIGWSAAVVGIYSFMTEVTPTSDVTRYTISFQQAAGLALFAAPMLASLLVQLGLPVVTVLLLGVGVRLLAAVVVTGQPPAQDPAPAPH